MQDFLWKGKDKGKNDHLVNCKTVSFPKEKGGLAIGNIMARSIILLGNWGIGGSIVKACTCLFGSNFGRQCINDFN
ncbi:hypothetical protein CsSME_00029268 [Camellia sinensis var. sinensis]